MDFATRAYDHTYRFDPIIRSLLDIDFYKLLMQQFIWEKYPLVNTEWSVINRTTSVKLADDIDIAELSEQLRHVQSLRFTPSELIWLRGQTFYGQNGIFKAGYLDALRTFHLPDFRLEYAREDTAGGYGTSGQFRLTFTGPWWQTTMWEIYALAIINELRSRSQMKNMSRSGLDIMYARAKVRLHDKLDFLSRFDDLNLSDFGTRRRHGFLWQEHCVLTAKEVLGDCFTGTSNVHLAMKHGLEPKGTNAHELPMVFAALADSDEALEKSQYDVLQHWQNMYQGNLLVFLPDTFGTTQFLANAPVWLNNWTGARPDSKGSEEAGEELIEFWRHRGLTPEAIEKKLILFSDGLDAYAIADLHKQFRERVRVGFGWGTNLTNDFGGTDDPLFPDRMKAISLVCKVSKANKRHAVKLSDNISKATGDTTEVARYVKVFGRENVDDRAVLV